MDDKKQKVQRANNVLDNYIKSKRPGSPSKSDYSSRPTTTENPQYDLTSSSTEKNMQESEINVIKLDTSSLKRKTDQFDSLSKKIKHLQDELSEKSERISALEIENAVLRRGNGDGVAVFSPDGMMIKELQKMVDARDTFIQQLSDSLQQRSEELQASILREKELAVEIQNLQQHVNSVTKQSEMKLSESYSEGVEYKAKVELMTNQIQEYSVLVQSLRATMENNNKELLAKKEELDAKEKKLDLYKSELSEDVKILMRQVEVLNHDLSIKEKELVRNKKEVEEMQAQLEEQFGAELVALKAKLESKYAEDVKKVESLYDGMMLEQIRKSDDQSKAVEDCSVLTDRILALREVYTKEINKYKEQIQAQLIESKANEDKLSAELMKYKQEADHYRQQVENFENKVAEEVRKIQSKCFKELDQYESEAKEEKNKYQIEIQKLAKKLKDNAVIDAKKEVELESYKSEIVKLQNYIHSAEEKFKCSQIDYENQISQLMVQITDFKTSESKLMNELRICRARLLEYEDKVYEFNADLKDKSTNFSEKYQSVVRTFEEQIQNLMNELERTKAYYEGEKSNLKSILNEKENQIKNLEAKLTFIDTLNKNKANKSDAGTETTLTQDSDQELIDQINTLKNNLLMVEKHEKSNIEVFLKTLTGLKEVKSFMNRIARNETEENTNNDKSVESEVEKTDRESVINELEKTINDILNLTHSFDLRSVQEPSTVSSIFTSTPRVRDSTDHSSDPSSATNDPGNDLVKKCELLEAENIKLSGRLQVLLTHMKEMEYCFYVTSKESALFDEKCKDLDSKITELETLKYTEFKLKKENNELKERLSHVEECEKTVRKEFAELVEKNLKLEKMLNQNLKDLHQQVANNGPNINLEAVLSDLKAKSDEVVRLRSQLSAVQSALKDNQERMMQLKAQCDKFIAEHDFLMSEIKTKQKELEDVWKERNELSTENKMLQSKLMSVQAKSSWTTHKIPTTVKLSTTSTELPEPEVFSLDKELSQPEIGLKTPVPESIEDSDDYHLKRLQTMHMLTESIAMSSKTNLKESSSNLSVSSRIDLELQELDEMFDESDNLFMPTITEEDEEFSDEVRIFFNQMAQGDQNKEGKEKVNLK